MGLLFKIFTSIPGDRIMRIHYSPIGQITCFGQGSVPGNAAPLWPCLFPPLWDASSRVGSFQPRSGVRMTCSQAEADSCRLCNMKWLRMSLCLCHRGVWIVGCLSITACTDSLYTCMHTCKWAGINTWTDVSVVSSQAFAGKQFLYIFVYFMASKGSHL